MKEIIFNQAQWIAQNQEYANEVVNSFKKISAKVIANTQIQLIRFDIIDEALEIQEFIQNDDINATVVKKIEKWIEYTSSFIESDEYQKVNDALCKFSSSYSKLLKHSDSNEQKS